jgi:Flp pilus assembly protein TadG
MLMSRFRPNRPDPRSDSGAAAVEFALVVPILLILVFGIISFGIVLSQQLTLGNSARQAARYVVVQDRTCADVMNQVLASGSTVGMNPQDITVTVGVQGTNTTLCGPAQASFSNADAAKKPCVGTAVGDSVVVTARFRSSVSIPLLISDPAFDLSSRGVFRCEYR